MLFDLNREKLLTKLSTLLKRNYRQNTSRFILTALILLVFVPIRGECIEADGVKSVIAEKTTVGAPKSPANTISSPVPAATPQPTPAKSSAIPAAQATPVTSVTIEEIVNPYKEYTYEQMMKDAQLLQKRYPGIIRLGSLGKSVEGREILLVELGKGERKITLNGSHHAREYISTTVLMKMIEQYASCYTANKSFEGYNTRDILNKATICFVPMVNPDGVTLVQQGPEKMKEPDAVRKINGGKSSFSSWKANARGVDLNYQYPCSWNRISKAQSPSSEGYKGTSPATEPEVKALMEYTLKNPFLIHVAYHTQGEILYWYNRQTGEFYDLSRKIGLGLEKITGYRLMAEKEQQNSYGGYKDWTVTYLKKPGYTIELCPYVGNYPYPDKQFDDAWKKADATGLFFASEAINMKGYDFEVHHKGKLVQVFSSEQDAEAFAKELDGGTVVYLNNVVYANN